MSLSSLDHSESPPSSLSGAPDAAPSRPAPTHAQAGELFPAYLSQTRDAVLIAESTLATPDALRVTYANDAFLNIFGTTRQEMIGKSPWQILPPESYSANAGPQTLYHHIAQKEPGVVTLLAASRDGQLFWTEVNLYPAPQHNGTEHSAICWMIVFRDTRNSIPNGSNGSSEKGSGGEEQELALSRALEREMLLRRIAEYGEAAETAEDFSRQLTREFCHMMKIDACALYIAQSATNTQMPCTSFALSAQYNAEPVKPGCVFPPLLEETSVIERLRSGKTLHAAADMALVLKDAPWRSLLAFGVQYRGAMIAAIIIADTQVERCWHAHEFTLLHSAMQTIGMTLAHTQMRHSSGMPHPPLHAEHPEATLEASPHATMRNALYAQALEHTARELCTPLAVIHSSAQLLAEQMSDLPASVMPAVFIETATQHRQRIRRATDQIQAVLSDMENPAGLCVISSLEDSMTPGEYLAILKDCVTDHAARFPALSLRISASSLAGHGASGTNMTAAAAQVRVPGNAMILGFLLSKLMDNACTYSRAGGRITVTHAWSTERMEIRIADEGIGIPANEITHVFEPRYRGMNALHIAGDGMGLYFAEQLARLLGGALSLHSRENEGCECTLELPLR